MRKFYLSFLLKALLPVIGLFLVNQLKAQITVTIGAGSNTATTSNSATADAGPMYCTGSTSTFVYSKHHMVYTASELATAGVPAGVLITKIEWNKANNAAYTSASASIFDIYLKNSSATGVPSTVPQSFASIISGATQVYASTSQSFPATIGWVEFNLSSPFLYTGSALELSTNWDISAGGSTASGATANFAWAKDPGINILSHTAATQSPDFTLLRTTRAQIRITYVPATACTSPPTPGDATASVSTPICPGTSVQLGLTGNSIGSGQTYVWQSASSLGGPYGDISSSSLSPSFSVSPTVTTWYRCAVTCSGNTQFSDTVQVLVNPAFPGGTYTINSAVATGGGNYQTFADAVTAISCGISGPVVFNVAPGSGPYNEQVTIPQIGGASSVNTVTFNGNLNTLSFNSTNTNARAGMTLNGADHIIIDSLIIDGTAGTYGWGILLTGQADSNTISNCIINVGPAITTTNHAGIIISGSMSSATTSGNNGNYNSITGNTINGGYYGVIFYGNSAAGAQNLNNTASKNIVTNAYAYTIYLAYQSGALVDSNDISRPARTSVLSGGAGVYFTTGNINSTVSRNRIHNMFDAATTVTSTLYNIYVGADASAGQENKIINNLIYNSGGNGIVYGIYNTGAVYMQAYHNTISLDDQVATSGAAYGLYQTGIADGLDYKNNVVLMSRSGTGTKRCIYFVTTTSSISCNNNVLYLTSSGGTNNHVGQYGTTNYTTFADWQTANSNAFDQQGVGVDPQFVNPTTGDYTPSNALANNTGIYVGVDEDIQGNTRDMVSPDAGAFEFSLIVAGLNMSAESLVTPDVSATGCYTATETVTVRIRNNGSTTINMATNPVTVTVNVTGTVTQMLTTILNSGTLVSNGTMDVVLPGTLNMSTAGVYTFDAFTTVTGDTNPADNAMQAVDRTKVTLSAGTATVTPDIYCVSQPTGPVLSTDGTETGYSSLQWQQSATSGSGFTNIVGADMIPYTVGSVTQNTYYRLVAGCGAVTQNSPEVLVTFVNPQIISSVPGARCGPGMVTLSATGSAGTTVNWYEAASGGTPLATGNNFITPVLNNTTTFYAEASTGGGISYLGPLDPSIGANGTWTSTAQWLNFSVLSTTTIQSVDMFWSAVIGSNFTIVIRDAGTLATVFTYNGITTTTGITNAQVVPINALLAPGTYQMNLSGTNPGTYRNTTGGVYPYTIPGVISITGNTFDPVYYYMFYHWAVGTGCDGVRVPVDATINTAPAFSVTEDTIVCNNATTALTITSNQADFNSYIWTPSAGLFTDAGATTPYTGATASTVYAKTATAGIHKYYVNASNSTTMCANLDSVSVTVLPAALTISATRTDLCAGETTTLSVQAGEYGSNVQWYSSPDGITYSPIAGANSNIYTTAALTDTTRYKLEIKNGAGAVCLQPTIVINVNSPQVLSTSPGSRCGPGTVTLGATSAAGITLKWYEAMTGGTAVGTGNTFTTPFISTTTNYYVAASTVSSSAPAALQVGTGTTQNANNSTTNLPPYGNYYTGNRHQILVLASELSAQGLSSGSNITSLAFDVVSNSNALGYNDFTIRLGHTTASALSTTFLTSSTTQVFTAANFQPSTGWSTHTFTAPFVWDGTSNLLVETYFSNCGNGASACTGGTTCTGSGSGVTWSQSAVTNQTSTAFVSHAFYYSDGASCNPQTVATASSAVSVRPNMLFGILVGCESPRTPVTASINAAPAFSVSEDTLVCNNAITALTITSNQSDFNSYIWTPSTGLFTDAGATTAYTGGSIATVYIKMATAGIHKYYVNAANSTTLCANLDSVSVTVLPQALTISATRTDLCVSGTTILSVPAGQYGNNIQWYSSPDGVTYSPIAGANSNEYTTPTINATTHYKLEIKNGAGVVCLQPGIIINVNNPQVLTTAPVTRCGPGIVTLGATVVPNSTAYWYSTMAGGVPIATGNSFVTPILSSTTTYYVSAAAGFTALSAGRTAPVSAVTLGTSPRGIQFNATQPVKLVSVKVFSTAAAGGSGTIELRNSAGVTIAGPVNVSWAGGGSTANPLPSELTLNFDVPVGTGHRLLMTTYTGGTITYETTGITGTWANYSSVGGEVELTASMTSATATSTSAYYFFYDWLVTAGCESSRTAVTATVTPGPAFSVAKDSLVCNDAITALSVESNTGDFDSYTWSPMTGLFTDAAATIPYSGGSATTLYAKIATAGVHKYYITANNSSTLCGNIDSVRLTVLPSNVNLEAIAVQICQSGSTTISLPAGEYGSAALQWYSSPDGIGYSQIAGATSMSYTTPVITTTTYYKVEIKNGAGAVCLQPAIMISVGIPEIITTVPGVRCDPGTVTLAATAGPTGAIINWYENANGGLPIATGSSFITPVLNATTTYYAASGFGYTAITAGKITPTTTPLNLTASPRGIQFNATVPVKLQSVTVLSTNATAGSGTIEVRNSAGVTIAGPANVSWAGGGTTAAPIPRVLDLNFDIPVGTGHRLLMVTGTTGGIGYESSGMTPALWASTASAGGEVQPTASLTSLTATSATTYYYFYDWKITVGCESPRVPVDAVINGSITIDAAPISQALCSSGQDVIFSVSASGAISTYQWRKNGVEIPGAMSPTLTVNGATSADAGSYDVIISGPCDTDTSVAAMLTLNAPVVITQDPAAQLVCPGGSVTFSAGATGTGSLGYQWRKDGIDIVGAYSASFTINNASSADIGSYDVVVTGTCNKDTSIAAALTIGAATAINTQPISQVACGGTNVSFTVVGAGTGTLTYQWRKGGVNILGATSATYTINGVTAADAGSYDVVVGSDCDSAISNVAGLTVNDATIITVQPVGQSSCNGSNVTFSVAATGSGVLTYQWRKGGVNIPGAVASSYTINNVSAADIGSYDVLINGTCGTLTSATAGLTISAAGTWIGVLNSDWNNAANWCGAIPNSTTDVTIPASAPFMPVLSSTGAVRNISIQNGASVTVIINGILNLYGNITGAGMFTSTAGSILFRGTTPQSVPAFTATNVTMNGAGGLTLGGNTTITGTLTLTAGHITLGANDLSLATGSSGSVGSHLITNGNGRVVVTGLAASSSRIIPVGIDAASYTPVMLTANQGHVTDNLFVRVLEHVLANGTSGNQLTRFVVDRTWMIDEAVPGGSNVNITLQWNAAEELQDFGRNESYVMQYTGNTWVTGTETSATGANPYTQSKQNVTSFSPFAVQTDPLPIVGAGIFPNPTNSILNIVVRTNAPEQLTVSVYDLTGRLMKKQRQAVGFGGTLLGVDVTGFAAGTYVVKISTPGNRELLVRKFVKVN